MHPILRLMGIGVVFVMMMLAWFILGGVMVERTHSQNNSLRGKVSDLWGSSQTQQAPSMSFQWQTQRDVVRTEEVDGVEKKVRETVWDKHSKDMSPVKSQIDVEMALDQRLKGLMWYSLYDVSFTGEWRYVHEAEEEGVLNLGFQFPNAQGLYDDFRFVVNGKNMADALRPENGRVGVNVPVQPGDEVTLKVGYKSRGMDEWRYSPAEGVANLEDFKLTMVTDFEDIDFPSYTMSPSERTQREDGGWSLEWRFAQVVTGHGIGMVTPQPIQPGQLASSLAFSAPVSLGFFFLVLFLLGTLRDIDLHPINYLLLGSAFFAFHLLFSYSVDHLQVVPAFALSSAVSIALVVSYLRLVVSARFAFVEAALAQLIYLVGFSLAHFWDGFTGLTVTVLSIVTLFGVMQLTGRIRWAEVLSPKSRRRAALANAVLGEHNVAPEPPDFSR